jgi:hypothetical protein
MFTVNHGTITLSTNQKAYAAVDILTFPNFTQGPHTPIPTTGTTGTLTLKNPPYVVGRYTVGNVINYTDGNNNNNIAMTITSVVGPSKYSIRVN